MVLVLGVLLGEKTRVRHGVHEAEVEKRRCREASRYCVGRRRLGPDPQRQGAGGEPPADVFSTRLCELVATGRRVEPRGFEHPLPAHAATGGRRVARAALVLVVRWPEALGGTEYAVEELGARAEPCQLTGPEARISSVPSPLTVPA